MLSVEALLATIAYDQLVLPNLNTIAPPALPDGDRLSRIEGALEGAASSNASTVRNLYKLAGASVVFSVLAGAVATISLILK